ncbi:hypothetical protein [Stenotrophomonas maltophilia]|uniref:hypothetical protein n=1 Tax=Stenotrophomonas maltophilia TaxID=40324 RepID=UPI0007EFB077|nr:hypothetical protein [Stenotrophomonas maltophilia]OBU55094.1 hypothetical protein A9K69_01325 [Stenotrophomonas maltophilia]
MEGRRATVVMDLNGLPYDEVVALVRQGSAYIKVNQSALSSELHLLPPSRVQKAATWLWLPSAIGFVVLLERHAYVWAFACLLFGAYSLLAARKADARRAVYAVLREERLYHHLLRAQAIRVLPR